MFICVAYSIPGYRKQWMAPTDRSRTPSRGGHTTKLAAASGVGVPPLTVWVGSAMYTYPVDRDVIVGRDHSCDIGFHDIDPDDLTLISRVHAILRFDNSKWVVVDKSQNGIYVGGARATLVPIHDRMTITLGSPRGPQLTFRVATSAPPSRPRTADEPPGTSPKTTAFRPAGPPPPRRTQTRPRLRPPGPQTHPSRPLPRPAPPRTAGPRDTTTVGRAKTNTIVVDDALASRVHAVLETSAAGLEIRDNNSSNGTFVNGTLITRAAMLQHGDVVTIGNTDLLATGSTLVPQPAALRTSGLTAHGLALTIDGRQLLKDVSFTAKPGTLTAVIGPSGAGKSTLVKLIGGALPRSAGVVAFDGHDVHAEYASMRSRIGVVPQDDVVHRQLTVEQALSYAAELRLPPDTSIEDRRQVVERVLDELELTPHKKTRVDKLSGGQRKRASVAMELLTGPSLLILDEPTSGLDPALDRQVMTMLRRLADAGRVVIVVTHSLTYVNMCDQLLLLAPGGKTAFADPPSQIGAAMGSTDWADIFARVSTDPDGVHRAFRARHPAAPTTADRRRSAAGKAAADQPMASGRDAGPPSSPAHDRRSRVLRFFGAAAVRARCAVAGGARQHRAGERQFDCARRTYRHPDPAQHRRGVYGDRADRARSGRRADDFPARAGCWFIGVGLPDGQSPRLQRRGADRDRRDGGHHDDRERCTVARRGAVGPQCCGRRRRALADPGFDGHRVGDARARTVVSGPLHRAGAADAGGGHHDLDGDGRWSDTGDRATTAGPGVVAGAGPLGFRRRGVDRRSEQHRGRAARRPVVATRARRVAGRHGHAYRAGRCVYRRRSLPAAVEGTLSRCRSRAFDNRWGVLRGA